MDINTVKGVIPQVGQPVVNWRQSGTKAFPGWLMGESVSCLKDLKTGEVYLWDSEFFNALNMVKITRRDESLPGFSAVYGRYVSPKNPELPRMNGDNEFLIFGSEEDRRFYQVTKAE
jgi:hypothetical protein